MTRPLILVLTLALMALTRLCPAQHPDPQRASGQDLGADPAAEVSIELILNSNTIRYGAVFSLTVVRAWSGDLKPAPWNDSDLSPLHVRLVETSSSTDADRIREIRQFDCYAFQAGEVTVPAFVFRARAADGTESATFSDPVVLQVASSLSSTTSATPELPGDLMALPGRGLAWWTWGLIGLAALLPAVMFFSGRQRRAGRTAVAKPTDPRERALRRLSQLHANRNDCRSAGLADLQCWYVEASALVRDFIEDHFGLRAPLMTTEQFLASRDIRRELDDSHRALLAEFLVHCDRVKFACHEPSDMDCGRTLDAASQFVKEARDRPSEGAGASTASAGLGAS